MLDSARRAMETASRRNGVRVWSSAVLDCHSRHESGGLFSERTSKTGRRDPTSSKTDQSDVVELTPEQGRELFDRRARKLLGITGDEFLARWDSGDFMNSDDPKVSSLAVLNAVRVGPPGVWPALCGRRRRSRPSVWLRRRSPGRVRGLPSRRCRRGRPGPRCRRALSGLPGPT